LDWQQVSLPPADSTEIVDEIIISVDTSKIWLTDGSLTVISDTLQCCGNINSLGPCEPDITDLIYMVNFMFNGGDEPDPMWVADLNCSDLMPDIADLIFLVDFMFNGGPAPCDSENCL